MQPAGSKRPTGKRGCAGHTKAGDLCGGPAVDGTDLCRMHPGIPLSEHKAKGAIVTTIRRWKLDDLPEDPGLLALKLMSVTEWNRQGYEAEIDRILDELDVPLSEALVGDSIVVDKDGSPHKVGEYIRGIVQLEAQERKLAADLAFKVLGANVAERLTRAREQVAELTMAVLAATYRDLGIDLTDPRVLSVVSSRIAELDVAS